MNYNKSDFYIHLLSDSSAGHFPNNVTSEFTTQLAEEVALSGQWEVALCNIYYHRTWVNIATPEDGTCGLILWQRHEDGQKITHDKMVKSAATLEPGSYSTPTALISAIYEKHRFLERWDAQKSSTHKYFALSEVLDISHNVSTNKLTFAMKENPYSCDGISLHFSSTLLDLMGHVEYDDPPHNTQRSSVIQMLLTPGTITDKDVPGVPSSQRKTLERTINLSAGIQNLFCYSSLVKNIPVGDTQAPLLRIVPVQGAVGEYLYETFDDRQYIPLRENNFRTIDVLIGDRFGKRIKFNHGSAPVILVLHFKRVA